MIEKLGVIGGGAWGTALAQVAAAGGEDTLLWAREPEVVASVNESHENATFLAGYPLNPAIRATGNLSALTSCDALLVVTPAQHLRPVLGGLGRWDQPLIPCSKGLEAAAMHVSHGFGDPAQPRPR